jgi:DNA-binding Lrp family transcriptional regulator
MEQFSIDAVDLQILTLLQRDASMTNQALAKLVHISPPTCLRRIKRMRLAGVIERQLAILNPEKLNAITGYGLTAIVEVTLDRQDGATWEHFEEKVASEGAVQQCYRVSPGPDFVLVVHAPHMPFYLELTQRLFTSDANVRNVKTFFSLQRSKFGAELPLP